MRVFDTHAHYDSGAFNADRLELLAGMPQQDVALIVNPGCDLETSAPPWSWLTGSPSSTLP